MLTRDSTRRDFGGSLRKKLRHKSRFNLVTHSQFDKAKNAEKVKKKANM